MSLPDFASGGGKSGKVRSDFPGGNLGVDTCRLGEVLLKKVAFRENMLIRDPPVLVGVERVITGTAAVGEGGPLEDAKVCDELLAAIATFEVDEFVVVGICVEDVEAAPPNENILRNCCRGRGVVATSGFPSRAEDSEEISESEDVHVDALASATSCSECGGAEEG